MLLRGTDNHRSSFPEEDEGSTGRPKSLKVTIKNCKCLLGIWLDAKEGSRLSEFRTVTPCMPGLSITSVYSESGNLAEKDNTEVVGASPLIEESTTCITKELPGATSHNIRGESSGDVTASVEVEKDAIDFEVALAGQKHIRTRSETSQNDVEGAPVGPACCMTPPTVPSVPVDGSLSITGAVSAVLSNIPCVAKLNAAMTGLKPAATIASQNTIVPQVQQTGTSPVTAASAVAVPAVEPSLGMQELGALSTETALKAFDETPPIALSSASVSQTTSAVLLADLTALQSGISYQPCTQACASSAPDDLQIAVVTAGNTLQPATETSGTAQPPTERGLDSILSGASSMLTHPPPETVGMVVQGIGESTDGFRTSSHQSVMVASKCSREIDVSTLVLPAVTTSLCSSICRKDVHKASSETRLATDLTVASLQSASDTPMDSAEWLSESAVDAISPAPEFKHMVGKYCVPSSLSTGALQDSDCEVLPAKHRDSDTSWSHALPVAPLSGEVLGTGDLGVKVLPLAVPSVRSSAELVSASENVLCERDTSAVQGSGVCSAADFVRNLHGQSNNLAPKNAFSCSTVHCSALEASSEGEHDPGVLRKSCVDSCKPTHVVCTSSDFQQQPCVQHQVAAAGASRTNVKSLAAGGSKKCQVARLKSRTGTFQKRQISSESPVDISNLGDVQSSARPKPRCSKTSSSKSSRGKHKKHPTIIPLEAKVKGLCDPRILKYLHRNIPMVSDLQCFCWAEQNHKEVQAEAKLEKEPKKELCKEPVIIPLDPIGNDSLQDPRLDFYRARERLQACRDKGSKDTSNLHFDLDKPEGQMQVKDGDNSQGKGQAGEMYKQEDSDHEELDSYDSSKMSISSTFSSPRGGSILCEEKANWPSAPAPSLMSAGPCTIPSQPLPLIWNAVPTASSATSTYPWPSFPVSQVAACYSSPPYPQYYARRPPLSVPIMPLNWYHQPLFVGKQPAIVPPFTTPCDTLSIDSNTAVGDDGTAGTFSPEMPPPLPSDPQELPPLPLADMPSGSPVSPQTSTLCKTLDANVALSVAVNDLLGVLCKQSFLQSSHCSLKDMWKLLRKSPGILESAATSQVDQIFDLIEAEQQLSSDQAEKLLSIVNNVLDLVKFTEDVTSPTDTSSFHQADALMPQEQSSRHGEQSRLSHSMVADQDNPLLPVPVNSKTSVPQILQVSKSKPTDTQHCRKVSRTSPFSADDYILISSDTDGLTDDDSDSSCHGHGKKQQHATYENGRSNCSGARSVSPRSSLERKLKQCLIRPESHRHEQDFGFGLSHHSTRSDDVSANRCRFPKYHVLSSTENNIEAKGQSCQELDTPKPKKARLVTSVDECSIQVKLKSSTSHRSMKRKPGQCRLEPACTHSPDEAKRRK